MLIIQPTMIFALVLIYLTPATATYMTTYLIMAQYLNPMEALASSIILTLWLYTKCIGWIVQKTIFVLTERDLQSNWHDFKTTHERALDEIQENPQSTHKASIHQSATESAQWLAAKYQPERIPVQQMTQAFKSYIAQESTKHASETQQDKQYREKLVVAEQGFDRVIEISSPYLPSRITHQTLLQLIWMFIHDHQIVTNPNDALPRLINSLYDIQRNAKDNAQIDDPICVAGVFHKLIESVSGYDDHCKLVVITPEMATVKLPCMVREEALKYLKSLPDKERRKAAQKIEKEDSVLGSILEKRTNGDNRSVKQIVADRMWNEFGSIFNSTPHAATPSSSRPQSFTDFIEAGAKYTTLAPEQLSALETGTALQTIELHQQPCAPPAASAPTTDGATTKTDSQPLL